MFNLKHKKLNKSFVKILRLESVLGDTDLRLEVV